MAITGRSCLVISWRISHLGMNPVRGGSPPKERRVRGAIAVRAGALVHEMASWLIVVALFALKIRKVGIVITK